MSILKENKFMSAFLIIQSILENSKSARNDLVDGHLARCIQNRITLSIAKTEIEEELKRQQEQQINKRLVA